MNPIMYTNTEPWNTPKKSGNFLSKYLLCKYTTNAAIRIPPNKLVSIVGTPAIAA